MLDEFEVVTIPLEKNPQGVIRVAGTRVSLDSIMHAYNTGATAEEIVLRFPSCSLDKIYTILSWALNHPQIVSEYLAEQSLQKQQLEAEIKRSYPSTGVRERLLARSRNSQK